MTTIDISICPTALEFDNGDRYDETRLVAAVRRHFECRYPSARVSVQIGHRQGDAWATIDGDGSRGEDEMAEFWQLHASDERLFAS